MKHQIIDKCSEALFQAIEVDHALNGSASHSATAVVHTNDGCVELYIDCYGAQASVVNKLSEAPDDDLCKTDKATVSQWLDLMAELIPQLPNGSTLLMQNNARRMKLMSKKLKKQLHKS